MNTIKLNDEEKLVISESIDDIRVGDYQGLADKISGWRYFNKRDARLHILLFLKQVCNIELLKLIKDTSSLFQDCPSLKSIVLPNNIEVLGRKTFADCYNLTSVTISDGVQEIGYQAFYGCINLEEIKIPNSVKKIGYLAFNDCTELKEINFDGTMSQWESIEKPYDWGYCSYIQKIVCTDG